MTAFRRLLLDRRTLSAWIVAIALLMKLLVPAGYMPALSAHGLAIELCSGAAPMTAAMPGMTHGRGEAGRDGDHHGKAQPCAYSGLTAPALPAIAPPAPAAAIIAPPRARPRTSALGVARVPDFLRPPLRGPPARG